MMSALSADMFREQYASVFDGDAQVDLSTTARHASAYAATFYTVAPGITLSGSVADRGAYIAQPPAGPTQAVERVSGLAVNAAPNLRATFESFARERQRS